MVNGTNILSQTSTDIIKTNSKDFGKLKNYKLILNEELMKMYSKFRTSKDQLLSSFYGQTVEQNLNFIWHLIYDYTSLLCLVNTKPSAALYSLVDFFN